MPLNKGFCVECHSLTHIVVIIFCPWIGFLFIVSNYIKAPPWFLGHQCSIQELPAPLLFVSVIMLGAWTT